MLEFSWIVEKVYKYIKQVALLCSIAVIFAHYNFITVVIYAYLKRNHVRSEIFQRFHWVNILNEIYLYCCNVHDRINNLTKLSSSIFTWISVCCHVY